MYWKGTGGGGTPPRTATPATPAALHGKAPESPQTADAPPREAPSTSPPAASPAAFPIPAPQPGPGRPRSAASAFQPAGAAPRSASSYRPSSTAGCPAHAQSFRGPWCPYTHSERPHAPSPDPHTSCSAPSCAAPEAAAGSRTRTPSPPASGRTAAVNPRPTHWHL